MNLPIHTYIYIYIYIYIYVYVYQSFLDMEIIEIQRVITLSDKTVKSYIR